MNRQTLLLCRTATRAIGAAEDVVTGPPTICAACSIGGLSEELSWYRDDGACHPASVRSFISLAAFQPCSRGARLPSQPLHPSSAGCTSVAAPPDLSLRGHRQLTSLQHSYVQKQYAVNWCHQRSFASQSHTDSRDADIARRRTPAEAASVAQPAGESQEHSASGWTRREVWNAPNAISLARLLSGPVIASWIIAGKTDAALVGLVISGWSDWLDGYVARRFNQQSTIGSYLDPLADKVLICSVVAALGIEGTLPGYLSAVIIGRDVFLVGATFAARASQLGWRRVSIPEFFRIASQGQQALGGTGSCTADEVEGAGKVTPLYVSKVNTVLQLATVAGFLLHAYLGWPPTAVLDVAAVVTAGTTVLSGAAYVQAYRKGAITA